MLRQHCDNGGVIFFSTNVLFAATAIGVALRRDAGGFAAGDVMTYVMGEMILFTGICAQHLAQLLKQSNEGKGLQ